MNSQHEQITGPRALLIGVVLGLVFWGAVGIVAGLWLVHE